MKIIIYIFSVGTESEGGRAGANFGRRRMKLNTGFADGMIRNGNIEELLIHEGAHASLEGDYLHVIEIRYIILGMVFHIV